MRAGVVLAWCRRRSSHSSRVWRRFILIEGSANLEVIDVHAALPRVVGGRVAGEVEERRLLLLGPGAFDQLLLRGFLQLGVGGLRLFIEGQQDHFAR